MCVCCVCLCLCSYSSVCVIALMCWYRSICVETRYRHQVYSFIALYRNSWDRVSHWPLEFSPVWQNKLDSGIPRSTCLSLPRARITSMCYYAQILTYVLRIKFGSSCLCDKHFNCWAISIAPMILQKKETKKPLIHLLTLIFAPTGSFFKYEQLLIWLPWKQFL